MLFTSFVHPPLSISVSILTDMLDSHGKLYKKQAWAAMIHSARVSQKIAMVFFGR